MAERITELPSRTGGAPQKYPWSEWTDGAAWRIERGADYEVPSTSMAAIIRQYAARNGLSVGAFVARQGQAVEFQFSRKAAA